MKEDNYFQAKYFFKNDVFRQDVNAELRGVWVTTVRNNDFPKPAVYEHGFNVVKFKKEFDDILATCQQFKLNALFFQVRPEGDAFYPSEINPWSRYLTGKQGDANGLEDFDPLAYVIMATQATNMEFHAWLNPYRLTPSTPRLANQAVAIASLSPSHYAVLNPEWTFFFNGQLFLNPGIPEVIDFVVKTVEEILKNYDVDAIHLDDFFYPYPYISDQKMIHFADVAPDITTYNRYQVATNQTITEWRTANINELVYQLHQTIKRYNQLNNQQVEFGISPFGIWASDQEMPTGSATSPNQLASLAEYVDSKLWVEAGWLDYIVPQVYWSFADRLSPFDTVAKWWNDVVLNTKTKLYIGLGLYLYEEDQLWTNPEEIFKQLTYLKKLPNVSGFVFFTYHNLVDELATSQTLKTVLKGLPEQIDKK